MFRREAAGTNDIELTTWNDLPDSRRTIFRRLALKAGIPLFLTPERVYYRAQFQLFKYYHLVENLNTNKFDELYRDAKQSEYWDFVDNTRVETIGEHALVELCVDCVMVDYLLRRLPTHTEDNSAENAVQDGNIVRVFELIYFRLLCHICPFVEGYIDMLDIEARAMMTLKSAAYYLSTIDLKQQLDYCNAVQNEHTARLPQTVNSIRPLPDGTKPHLLRAPLVLVEGSHKEASEYHDIKNLQHKIIEEWHTHLRHFESAGFASNAGLTCETSTLLNLISPLQFHVDRVVSDVHLQARDAVQLTIAIVEKACRRLYISQEQKEDGFEEDQDKVTHEAILASWRAILEDVKIHSKHCPL